MYSLCQSETIVLARTEESVLSVSKSAHKHTIALGLHTTPAKKAIGMAEFERSIQL